MAKSAVFVTRVIPDVGLERIAPDCDVRLWTEPLPPPPETLRERLQGCAGVLALLNDKFERQLLESCPDLMVISNYAVGYNNIDIDAATDLGIAVGNTPGVLTDATADMAFCLLIAAARRVVAGHHYVLDGNWRTWEPKGHIGQDLVGRTIGIVGMGRIGFTMASRCHRGWEMKVIYHDLHANDQADRELDATQVSFDTLLAESDFISIHTDLNESSRGMFNSAAFRKMKRTAVLVNTARGPIINTQDLCQALRDGEIFAAGLDVTDPEPIPPQHPLLALPNVIVVPHIASATVSSRNAMAEIAADNLLLGLARKPLRCWVNPEVKNHPRWSNR